MAEHKQKSVIFLLWRGVFSLALIAAVLDRAGIFSSRLNLKTFCAFTTLCAGFVLLVTLLDTVKNNI